MARAPCFTCNVQRNLQDIDPLYLGRTRSRNMTKHQRVPFCLASGSFTSVFYGTRRNERCARGWSPIKIGVGRPNFKVGRERDLSN